MDGGSCSSARLCFNGVTPVVLDAWAGDGPLAGSAADDSAIDAAVDALHIEEPMGDIHASGEYRVALAHAYGKRALKAARDRA